jgi:hypothetical protein
MMSAADVSLVNKNVLIGGGTVRAIVRIKSSSITPGPLGILPTKPSADAPKATAMRASSMELIQQILMRGFMI